MLDAAVMTDALRRDLVLDLDGCSARRLDLRDRPCDMDRVAEADTAVGDDCGIASGDDMAGRVD